MGKKVCFIGHRRIGYGFIEEKLKKVIMKEIESGCRHFIVGDHGAFDRLCLNVLLKMKKQYPDIETEIVITSLSALKNKTRYKNVKTVMFDIETVYFKRRITESNRQMIDCCDTVIAYVDEINTVSGAKTAYNYAKKKGLTIINIYDEKEKPTFGMTAEQKKNIL